MRTLHAVTARGPQPAPGRRFTPRRLAAAMAAGSLLTLAVGPTAPAVAQVQTLPTGLQVVAGQAQAVTNGNRMTVTNSSQAILNWNSFSIGAGNAVYFQQPGASSQVLNRVTGNDPSLIMGNLGSNGRVWLLNQNGVLFGQNARVDVAGLVASTLRLNDSDWLAGRYRFSDNGSTASVLNQGEMRTSFGGSLALVSGSVGNEGLMQAPGGQVILAAGKSVELVDTGAAYLSVRITAPGGEARNLGMLDAGGGRIDIHAAAVNQQGIVRADALASGPGGEIWIKASDNVTLAAGSRTSADGGQGGSVSVQADGGRSTVQGTVSAVGQSGSGGQVVLLGREVSVQDNARVDVSGSLGGGAVVVGGGDRGQDLRYSNAQAVYFGPQASITADATQQGDGGHIVLWSDTATRAYGALSARGGLLGGNGGSIETSGHWLDAQPALVDTSAPHGSAGSWLLDPYNIQISDSASTSGFGAGPNFTASTSNSSISTATINAALVNANVSVDTGGFGNGSEAGNITLSGATITSNVAAPRTIAFTADRSISVTGSTIRSDQGALSVSMQTSRTSAGGITIGGSTVTTGTGTTWGDINLGGTAGGTLPDGVTGFTGAGGNVPLALQLANATLNAGTGSIRLAATSSNGGGTAVSLSNATVTSRLLSIIGDAPIGVGVSLSGTSFVRATQTASVQGRGLATGVTLLGDAQLSVLPATNDTSASLTIEGAARSATGGSGVVLNTDASTSYAVLTGRGASMTIRGAANASDSSEQAIHISAATSAFNPIVDASGGDSGGGNNLTIQTFGNGRNVVVDNGAFVVGGYGTTQLQAAGDITLSNAVLSVRGTTTLAATNINLLNGSYVANDLTTLTDLTLNAQANVVINDLTSYGGPMALTLQAGLGGAGTVTVAGSYIISGENPSGSERAPAGRGPSGAAAANVGPQPNANGTSSNGDIIIGGSIAGTTPTGGSFTGAGGAGGSGVSLSNTTLNAGNANVSISGVATATGGVGVRLSNTDVSGNSITITGDAPSGTGVQVQKDSSSSSGYIEAAHDLAIKGRGLGIGVDILDTAYLNVYPAAIDATASGLIQGRALDTGGNGVHVSHSGLDYAIFFGNGASMLIEAAGGANGTSLLLSTQAGSNAPLISGSDPNGFGTLTVRTFDNGRKVQLTDALVVGGDGRFTVQAASEVNFSNSTLSSNGPVSITADRVQLLTGSAISSQASGDSITVSGSSTAPLSYFNNTAGAAALVAANSGGRWVVYATNPNDTANFNAGGLNYAFKRYNAAYGDWSLNSGNALVFSAPQTATLSGTVQTKVYDATTAATLSNVSVALSVAGDSAVQQSTAVAFVTPDVGTGIQAAFTSNAPYTFSDGSNRPVYGYTLAGSLSGNITRKTVTGTVTVPDRVYDTTTTAVLNIGPLSGLVGTQTLVASASGSFADKNAGSNKPISVSYALANGSNGGLASNYQFVGPITPTGNITQRPLAVGGVTASNKVYDATTAATLAGTAVVSALAGDSVTLGGTAVASFNTKNVGTAKPVSVSGYLLGGTDAANYSLVQPTGLTASITPRPFVTSGLSAADKVYDATTAATLSGTATGTALAGDTVTVSGTAAGSFADKNVGTGKAVTVTGLTLSGTDAANYSLVAPTATASITRRSVLLTGLSANSKVYDATTAATLSGTAAVTALAGDVLTVGGSASASFNNKNVGTGKAVTVTGYALAGADAGNYSLVQPTGLTAAITPRALTLAGVSAADKVYDATTAATLVGSAGVTALGGDTVSVSGTGVASFNNKNVGTAKPVGVSGYTLSGADAANYTLLTLNLSASITPRAVAVTGLVANGKVYDATTAATLSGTGAVAALGGDTLTLGGTAVATFSDKNVGTAKPVGVSGYTLSGTDAGNYTLLTLNLSASITPRAVAVTGLVANSKVYDATTAATLSGTGAVAALAGDAVTLAGTPLAAFSDKNVGTGKTVSVTGFALAGADAGNYTLGAPAGLAASITPLQLLLTGQSVAPKVYDGTTAATLAGSASVAGLAGDAVALTGTGSATFDTKNVGTGKTVVVTGYTLAGADAGNYTLPASQQVSGGTITPRPLAVTGLSANGKVYDGSTAATLAGTAGVAAISGDVVQLGGTPLARFADRNVGTAKPVAVTGYAISGTDAGNYSLVQPQGLSAAITPASLTYVAEPAVRSVGQTITDLPGTVTGFVGTDTLATATTGALAFTTPATAGSPAGTYPVAGGGLAATNYSFGQAPGNAQALSIVDLTPTTTTVVTSVAATEVSSSIATILSAPRQGADSGVANLTAAVAIGADPATKPVGDFKAVRLSSLSTADVQSLLAGRDLFKQALLAESVQKLQDNPRLADLRECSTVDEAQLGHCLITDKVKLMLARQQQQPAAPAGAATPVLPTPPTGPAPAAAPPAPPAPSTGATVPAPAPQAPPPLVAAAPPARVPVPTAPAADANVDPLLREVQLIRRRVLSASLPQIDRKVALVVGVDNYADKSIPPLGNAVRDARSVAQLFESKLGYEAVVLDNATKATLVGALNRLALTLGPRDSVVIYYAGHGELVESTKLGYWLLADSGAKDPQSWLSNTDISRLIGQIGASQVALISDSCYSGSLASEERIRAAPTTLDPKAVLAGKSVVIMSSGGNEPVFDEGRDGHSPFAWNLMNTLNKVADWQAGGNVFERVRFAVARELPQRPQYSASRAAGHQPGGDYLFEQRELAAGTK